jgi:hypothetical protein
LCDSKAPAEVAEIAEPVRLFSYGTLQDPRVQRANFGRELSGTPDRLPGYALATVEISDAGVAAVSGSDRHPIARHTGDPSDAVEGTVFELTDAELAAADGYEVDAYRRTPVTLESGVQAWVYAAAERAER